MIKKLIVVILVIFMLSACTGTPQVTSTPIFTPMFSVVPPLFTNTPLPTLTPYPTFTPFPPPTRTPLPTLVPSIGEYQGIGARQVSCGEIPLPPNIAKIECYNISGIGGARIYIDSSNKLVAMAITYKFGQGYDAGIFATKTASQYGWNVNDLIGLISMMENTGTLYTNGTISGICEVSEDNTMIYMLISPDASILTNGINVD